MRDVTLELQELAIGRPVDGRGAARFLTKTEMTYVQLRNWIVTGVLPPGQRLDQEWLASEMNVSRMPLREALLRLEADGLIRNEPHRSAVVSPMSLAEMTDVYAARRAIEGMLAERAVAVCDGRCLSAMEAAIAEQEAAIAVDDVARFVEKDRDFHFRLYEACGYQRSLDIASRLRDIAARYVFQYARYQGGASESIAEHRAILAGCRAGEASEVRILSERHIDKGLEVLRRLVDQSERDPGRSPAEERDRR